MIRSAIVLGLLLTGSVIESSSATVSARYEKVAGGVVVTPTTGNMRSVEVTVHADGIFHVVATPREAPGSAKAMSWSIIAPNPPAAGSFTVTERAGSVRIAARRGSAEINLTTGLVRFFDANGASVLTEARQPAFRQTMVDGVRYVTVSQQFNRNTDEALYGLGQQQNAEMDYNGEDVELKQQNMVIAVPFLVSTKGYGLLWDNNGQSRFGNPLPYTKVGEGIAVTSGGRPGFAARYFLNGKQVASRQETTIDYQYISDGVVRPTWQQH
jgi:alpha-D-xyloside xylohydrolase